MLQLAGLGLARTKPRKLKHAPRESKAPQLETLAAIPHLWRIEESSLRNTMPSTM